MFTVPGAGELPVPPAWLCEPARAPPPASVSPLCGAQLRVSLSPEKAWKMRGPTTSSSVLSALHQGQAASIEWVSHSGQTSVSLPSESFIFMGAGPGHHIRPAPPCSGVRRAQRAHARGDKSGGGGTVPGGVGTGGALDVGLAVPVLPPTPGLPGNRTGGLRALGAMVGQRGRRGRMSGSGGQKFRWLIVVAF